MTNIIEFIQVNMEKFNMPKMSWTDGIEILVIAFLIYEIMLWIKNTNSYALLKGIFVIAVFLLFAVAFEMNTILWIANNLFTIAATALVVIFQPELRRALEQLGRKTFVSSMFSFDQGHASEGRFSDRTVNELIHACEEMGKAKTGALIVIEQNSSLEEVERTGIAIDAIISSQLLINIFEHNTPLHDGAVVVRGNRVVAATCYLPLSDNLSLSKELGTRHRAGVGISEVTDSLTLIVSEETGRISIAYDGELLRNVNDETMRRKLVSIQNKPDSQKKHTFFKGKGGKE